MKFEKLTIYRLKASMSCGCQSTREFRDNKFKDPEGDVVFSVCAKHVADTSAFSILEMVLGEYLEDQASKAAPVAPPVDPNAPNITTMTTENHMPIARPANVRPTRMSASRSLATRGAGATSRKTAALNTAGAAEINLEEVPRDPAVDAVLGSTLEAAFDEWDDRDSHLG